MGEKLISSSQIVKLGHKLPEIRERALLNIVSKLERGVLYDNEIARSKELMTKLLDWFEIQPVWHEEKVLKLLKRILQNETGSLLIDLFGSLALKQKFLNVKEIVQEKNTKIVDDVLEILENNAQIVPPLELGESVLSYRSNDCSVEPTATTIEGLVTNSEQPLYSNRSGPALEYFSTEEYPFHFLVLPWQWLPSSDLHVLVSVEETLRTGDDPVAILNSCEFFSNILIEDFAAEVFLQRPNIVKLFHDLLWSCPSSRIATAILKSLNKLCTKLIQRVHFYSDPCAHNLKLNNYPDQLSSAEEQSSIGSDSSENETIADTLALMKKQINIPQFSLNCINCVVDYLMPSSDFKRKKCLVGINASLDLFKQCINLLKLSVKRCIWQSSHEKSEIILRKFSETFQKISEILNHFRLCVMSEDWNEEMRIIYMNLLYNFTLLFDYLIPAEKSRQVLPIGLKNALTQSLLDPVMFRIYPDLQETLLRIIKNFTNENEDQTFEFYQKVSALCQSITAAVEFSRTFKTLPFTKTVSLVKKSLLSLQLHEDIEFVRNFIDLCSSKLSMNSFDEIIMTDITEVLVAVLSHKNLKIKLAAYKLCRKKIHKTIGAKLNISKCSAPGSQILFLLRSKILFEFIVYGLNDEDSEVQSCSEDILMHILKCKILVCEEIWNEVVVALTPVLPILVCYAHNKTTLGRLILSVLDPDRSSSLKLPELEVLRCNIGLLFVDNIEVKQEAISRIIWILCSKNKSRNLNPNLNNLNDKSLALITHLERPIDYKLLKSTQHFYQPSSLLQVLDLLNSTNVEPVIRRSAITQIAVMMDDPLMHSSFLEKGGLTIVKNLMNGALIEDNCLEYPDTLIPCLAILKNLCLYNSSMSQQICNSEEFFTYILRGMFMFCTEERVKQDGSILLFFLVFFLQIRGSPLQNDLSILQLLINKLKVPFLSKMHGNISENCPPSIDDLLQNKWFFKSLQIHWNLEWFQGFENILDEEIYYGPQISFNEKLRLAKNDLLIVQSTSLDCIIQKHLAVVYEKSNSLEILNSIQLLSCCLKLYQLMKNDKMKFSKPVEELDWEKSLSGYLTTPPSESADILFLAQILNFLKDFIDIFHQKPVAQFINSSLSNPRNYFFDLLSTQNDRTDHDMDKLMNSILSLIISCVSNQHRMYDIRDDQLTSSSSKSNQLWHPLIEIIVSNLQFNDAQHFYNMAYLDHILCALVHLTSTLGWSNCKERDVCKKMLVQLVEGLFELLQAFQCGKSLDSFMGLNITRHIILIFNHVVSELQHFKIKNWEVHFLGNDSEEFALLKVCQLAKSRDLVLRASALHFIAGLAASGKIANELLRDVNLKGLDVGNLSLSILSDCEEASIVREHAAILATNLASFVFNENINFKNLNFGRNPELFIKTLQNYCTFREIEEILGKLYLKKQFNFLEFRSTINGECEDDFLFIYNKIFNRKNAWDSLTGKEQGEKFQSLFSITTFGLVKSVALFLHNLISPKKEKFSIIIQDLGLVKLFLRCVTVPNNEIVSTKDLIFYTEAVEMDTSICNFLSLISTKNGNCLATVANTRDCLRVVVSLLNPDLYITNVSHLLYLRNKLWCSIFNLLEVLLMGHHSSKENALDPQTIMENLVENNSKESFILTLCESLNADLSQDLQLSALSSLTSLLKYPEINVQENDDLQAGDTSRSVDSVRSLLDTTKTPRSTLSNFKADRYKNEQFSALEKIYFGGFSLQSTENSMEKFERGTAGAELCKILLNLYEILYLCLEKQTEETQEKQEKQLNSKKTLVLNTLTSLLLASNEAKSYALQQGLLQILVQQLKTIYIKLSLESCPRSIANNKRISPILEELKAVLGLMTNFIFENEAVKKAAAILCLADVCHKLWNWFLIQKKLLVVALRLLATFTNDCSEANESLPLTSAVAGSGPKKTANNFSLLHAICNLVGKEMDQVSKTHDLEVLNLCFQILRNSLEISDCRAILIKMNFLQGASKLHPAHTKRQKPWDEIERYWLDFMTEFALYSEGQLNIAKTFDGLEVVISLCGSYHLDCRLSALEVLRNVAFNPSNKTRLINSADFLNVLATKLNPNSNISEIILVVVTIWALACNSQKAKLVFKCAQLDTKLKDCLRAIHLSNCPIEASDLEHMHYVLNLLKEK